MGSRFKDAFLGVSSDLVGYFFLILAQFFVTPIFLGMTSASLYGFWLVILSVFAYFGLADLGIGMALTRLIAANWGDKEGEAGINGLVSTAFCFFLILALCLLVISWGCSRYIPVWLHVPGNESAAVLQAYMIAVVGAAIALPLNVFNSVVVGVQKMAVSNMIRMLISLLAIGLSVILLYSGYGLVSLAIGSFFQFVVIGLLNVFMAYKFVPSLALGIFKVNRCDFKRLFSYGGWFQLGKFANTVISSTDSIVIGFLMGTVFVSHYMLSFKLIGVVGISIASKLASAVFPAISQMFKNNQRDKLQQVFRVLSHYGLRIGIAGALGIMVINERFVALWVGQDIYAGNLLTAIFVAWLFVDSLNRGVCSMIHASGEIKGWAVASLYEAVANIVFSIIFIMWFGLIGAALGTLLTRTAMTIYVYCWLFRKLDISWKSFLLQGYLSSGIKSLLAAGVIIVPFLALHLLAGWVSFICLVLLMVVMDIMFFEGRELVRIGMAEKNIKSMAVIRSSWTVNCGC